MLWRNIQFENISNNFYRVECDIKNKITLRELCNNFKSGNWSADNFEVATHNSQIFAAEIIKIFKAIRKHEYDKIRKFLEQEKDKVISKIKKVLFSLN